MIQALLWDVDGTLAETERDGHRVAFNRAFAELGLPWRWGEAHYGSLLEVAGGRERILHDMEGRQEAPAEAGEREALTMAIRRRKNELYAGMVSSGAVPLREGVAALMEEARARGLRQGIVTTSGRPSVEVLLHRQLGASWADRFEVVVCGGDVTRKKPHPEAYLRALEVLGLPPRGVLALEDSPAGVAAARGAGVAVVLTRSRYFAHAPAEGALAAGPGLHLREGWEPAAPGRPGTDRLGAEGITLNDLTHWWSQGGDGDRRWDPD